MRRRLTRRPRTPNWLVALARALLNAALAVGRVLARSPSCGLLLLSTSSIHTAGRSQSRIASTAHFSATSSSPSDTRRRVSTKQAAPTWSLQLARHGPTPTACRAFNPHPSPVLRCRTLTPYFGYFRVGNGRSVKPRRPKANMCPSGPDHKTAPGPLCAPNGHKMRGSRWHRAMG